jgi:RNA polymerase sigma factor (sigma-70 family)
VIVARCVAAAPARPAPAELGGRHQTPLLRAAQGGDQVACEQLVGEFMPLIVRAARNYSRSEGLQTEELVQEGVVGLLIALERYDPELGFPFWAYASWWVRRRMQRLVAELCLPLVLSDRAFRQLADIGYARREHEQANRSSPSAVELAARTGYSREQIDSLMCVALPQRSLDEPLARDGDAAGTVGSSLADAAAEDRFEEVDRQSEREALRSRPNDLCERERDVLRARYGFDGRARTLREIGSELGLSAERVRQIQQVALTKLALAGSVVL